MGEGIDTLYRVKKLKNNIKSTRLSLAQFQTLATHNTASFNETISQRTNAVTDQVGDNTVKMVQLQHEVANDLGDLCEIYDKCKKAINQIPDDNYQAVLRNYFLNNLTVEETSNEMGFSDTWVKKIKKNALEEFERIWGEFYV